MKNPEITPAPEVKIELKAMKRLVESAQKNKRSLKALINAAIVSQEYELVVELKKIMDDRYPKSEESIHAKITAENYHNLFNLVKLGVPKKESYVIAMACKVYAEKGDEIDLQDAAKILANADEFFGDE